MSVAAEEVSMLVLPLNTLASMRPVFVASSETACRREDMFIIHTLRMCRLTSTPNDG